MNDKILNLLIEYDSSTINKKKEIIYILLKEEQEIFKELDINE
jgi:hypothetical protein